MALQPLQIQRPAVSLIGGKELPKASGEGVRAPDISNAFNQLSATLQQQSNQNAAIDDAQRAKLDAEKYSSEAVSKDPLGQYGKVVTPYGTPEYVAHFTNTLEQNAISDLQRSANTELGLIQARTDIDRGKKLSLMQGRIQGYLDALAPQFRPDARRYLLTEYGQRENQMVAEDKARERAAAVNGNQLRENEAAKAAVSAASAGVDYTAQTQKLYKAIDEQVGLGLLDAAGGEQKKAAYSRFIIVAGTQREIAQKMAGSDIDPDEALAFGHALTSGGSAEIGYDLDYQPFAVGESPVKKKIISTDQLRDVMQDEAAAQKMGSDIIDLATQQKAYLKSIEPELKIKDFVSQADWTDRIPAALNDDVDKMASQAIVTNDALRVDNGQVNKEGLALLLALTLRTGYMAKPLTAKLTNMLDGNLDEKKLAIEFWSRIRNDKEGTVDRGAMVVGTMPVSDVTYLDSMTKLMNQLVGSGADQQKQLQLFDDARKALSKPENTIGYWAGQYRATTGGTDLDTAIRSKFIDQYDTLTSMPPQYMQELEESYRIAMTLTTQPDPQVVLDEVFDRFTKRYAASNMFVGGMSAVSNNGDGNPWPNPAGYQQTYIGGIPIMFVHPNQWINDFTVEHVYHLMETRQLVLDDPDVRKAVNEALAAGGGELPLGTKLYLQASDTSLNATRFSVRVNMGDGTTMPLMIRDRQGKPVPLLVDPGMLHSQIAARATQHDDIETLKTTAEGARKAVISQQMDAQGMDLGTQEAYSILNDDIAFHRWFSTQPPDWQAQYLRQESDRAETVRKAIERYNDKPSTDYGGQSATPAQLNESKAAGESVTVGAIQQIENILPDGTGGQFLLNVALAESNMGLHPDTFRAAGDRGIWQINDGPTGAMVELRRRARIPGDPIQVAAEKLKVLGVDVANVTSSDLDKPIVSAALARLYFMTQPGQIPQDADGQAALWKSAYNTVAGAGSEAGFLSRAGKVVMPAAFASTGDGNETGLITDVKGNAYPANFTATLPATQLSAQRLAAAFGAPLRVTPHGGTQADARKSTSQHHRGTALDIYVADMSDADKTRLIATAIKMGYRGIGGYGAGDGVGTIHLDLRSGGKHSGGLALWWRHRPGVDGDWETGDRWYVEGVKQGMAMIGRNRA
jgi:hypothetical protein